MKATLLLCAASLTLSACVGGVAFTAKSKIIAKPTLDDSSSADSIHETPGRQKTPAYSSAWVKANWGEPSSIHRGRGGGEEVWIYNFGSYPVGVMPCVIVPIPLVVPAGKESVALTFKNGRVVSASQRTGKASAAIFGYMFGPCGPSAFGPHIF